MERSSGIPNYSADKEFDKKMMSNLSYVWTDDELISYAHPENPIEYKKNNPFDYSNTNYILAAKVIEKVTQDTYEHQLQVRIINQNNSLKNTFYLAGPSGAELEKSVLNRRIHGYFYDEDTKKLYDTITNDLSWAAAAGGLVANTEDVARWVQLLYRGTLINPVYRERALEELEDVVSIKTGLPIVTVTAEDPSGFGLGVGSLYDETLKQRFWFYQGSTLGFRVMYIWNPCNDVTVVVALNGKAGEGNPSSKMGNQIAKANQALYGIILKQHPELRCEAS